MTHALLPDAAKLITVAIGDPKAQELDPCVLQPAGPDSKFSEYGYVVICAFKE